MHEMGIAIEIQRCAREAVAPHGAGRIERVRLMLGELAAVEPELLQFAWEALTSDGPDAGSTLEIVWCPAQQYCPRCDAAKSRSEGSWLRLCPDCGEPLRIDGGDELDVLDLSFVSDEEDAP